MLTLILLLYPAASISSGELSAAIAAAILGGVVLGTLTAILIRRYMARRLLPPQARGDVEKQMNPPPMAMLYPSDYHSPPLAVLQLPPTVSQERQSQSSLQHLAQTFNVHPSLISLSSGQLDSSRQFPEEVQTPGTTPSLRSRKSSINYKKPREIRDRYRSMEVLASPTVPKEARGYQLPALSRLPPEQDYPLPSKQSESDLLAAAISASSAQETPWQAKAKKRRSMSQPVVPQWARNGLGEQEQLDTPGAHRPIERFQLSASSVDYIPRPVGGVKNGSASETSSEGLRYSLESMGSQASQLAAEWRNSTRQSSSDDSAGRARPHQQQQGSMSALGRLLYPSALGVDMGASAMETLTPVISTPDRRIPSSRNGHSPGPSPSHQAPSSSARSPASKPTRRRSRGKATVASSNASSASWQQPDDDSYWKKPSRHSPAQSWDTQSLPPDMPLPPLPAPSPSKPTRSLRSVQHAQSESISTMMPVRNMHMFSMAQKELTAAERLLASSADSYTARRSQQKSSSASLKKQFIPVYANTPRAAHVSAISDPNLLSRGEKLGKSMRAKIEGEGDTADTLTPLPEPLLSRGEKLGKQIPGSRQPPLILAPSRSVASDSSSSSPPPEPPPKKVAVEHDQVKDWAPPSPSPSAFTMVNISNLKPSKSAESLRSVEQQQQPSPMPVSVPVTPAQPETPIVKPHYAKKLFGPGNELNKLPSLDEFRRLESARRELQKKVGNDPFRFPKTPTGGSMKHVGGADRPTIYLAKPPSNGVVVPFGAVNRATMMGAAKARHQQQQQEAAESHQQQTRQYRQQPSSRKTDSMSTTQSGNTSVSTIGGPAGVATLWEKRKQAREAAAVAAMARVESIQQQQQQQQKAIRRPSEQPIERYSIFQSKAALALL